MLIACYKKTIIKLYEHSHHFCYLLWGPRSNQRIQLTSHPFQTFLLPYFYQRQGTNHHHFRYNLANEKATNQRQGLKSFSQPHKVSKNASFNFTSLLSSEALKHEAHSLHLMLSQFRKDKRFNLQTVWKFLSYFILDFVKTLFIYFRLFDWR